MLFTYFCTKHVVEGIHIHTFVGEIFFLTIFSIKVSFFFNVIINFPLHVYNMHLSHDSPFME